VADLFVDKSGASDTSGAKKKTVQVRAGQKQPKGMSKASKQTVGKLCSLCL